VKNVGCVQQLHRVAAGRARGRRQPYSVAEDDGGGAVEAVPGEERFHSVGGGRRACPPGLYPPQRVAVATEVKDQHCSFLNHLTSQIFVINS